MGDIDEETGVTDSIRLMNINIQCPFTQGAIDGDEYWMEIQDDNDYKYAPWPSNGITLPLDDIMEEIESGNCYLDETAYALWKEEPE